MRRVAVIDVAIEVADDKESHMKPRGQHGGCQKWWRIRESAVNEDGDASTQLSRRKTDAEDEVKAAMATRAPSLLDLRMHR